MIATNSPDYVVRFFELLEQRCVVVPLRSRSDAARIAACGVARIVQPEPGGGWVRAQFRPSNDPDLAQIAFTSGTEGEPKGILLTHANLANTVARLVEVMRMDASIREYVGIPVHHSFGFGRCRAIAAVGGQAYVPANGFNPREIAEMLRAGQINAISAVPSLWRIAIQSRHLFQDCGRRLRWIEIGSQAMPVADKIALREIFPDARIVQHYGLTEASRATFLDVSNATPETIGSVGRPNGDVEVSIAENGRIRIRGGNVAAELLVDGRSRSNVDADGWLVTGDLGELRDGNLHCLGRADEMVNLAGIKLSLTTIEERLRAVVGDGDQVCAVRVPDALRGDGILLAARADLPLSDEALRTAGVRALRDLGVDARSSLTVARFTEFPATDSGKLRRHALAEQYLERAARRDVAAPPAPTAPAEVGAPPTRAEPSKRSVRSLFARTFPHAQVGPDDTFSSLGGDSLSFIEVSIELEEILGVLPKNWHLRSVAELEGIARRRSLFHSVDTALFLRCVAIVAIVMGHFDVVDIGGATYLLLVIVGMNFARFQLGTVVESGSVLPLLATAARIAVPTFLALAVLQVKTGAYDPVQLLLLGNWRDAMTQQFGFWFLEMVPQIFLIVSLLLLVPAARHSAGRSPFAFACGVLAVTSATAWIAPMLWDAEPAFYRVPHMLMWLFALGWTLQTATTTAQKVAVALLAAILPFVLWFDVSDRFWLQHGATWVPAGCILLLGVHRIRLPTPLHKLVAWIAGASMFIYLMHYTGRDQWRRFGGVQHEVIDALIGILFGIAAWIAWEAATRFATKLWRKWIPLRTAVSRDEREVPARRRAS